MIYKTAINGEWPFALAYILSSQRGTIQYCCYVFFTPFSTIWNLL